MAAQDSFYRKIGTLERPVSLDRLGSEYRTSRLEPAGRAKKRRHGQTVEAEENQQGRFDGFTGHGIYRPRMRRKSERISSEVAWKLLVEAFGFAMTTTSTGLVSGIRR